MAIFTESRGWSRAWSRGHVVIFTEVTRLFLNLYDVFLLQNRRLGDFEIGIARKNSKIRVQGVDFRSQWASNCEFEAHFLFEKGTFANPAKFNVKST